MDYDIGSGHSVRRRRLVMTIGLVLGALVFTGGLPAQPTPEQASRIESLQREILVPCCWQEDVYTHRSELAYQMKDEIREMVLAGKSDREVLDHYKAQYGMRVLVEPEGGLWWVMNVVPAVVLVLGMVAIVFILRRWLKPLPAEPTEQNS